MLEIKRYLNQQDFKIVDLHFVKSKNFLLTWNFDSCQSETTSSGWKLQLNNLAVKGFAWVNLEASVFMTKKARKSGKQAWTPPPPPTHTHTHTRIWISVSPRHAIWSDSLLSYLVLRWLLIVHLLRPAISAIWPFYPHWAGHHALAMNVNPYNAKIFLCKPWRQKVFFSISNHHNICLS